MRRLILFSVLLAALAALPASALALPPAVFRDVQAAMDKLGSLRPAPAEYVQPDTQVEPSIAVNPNNPLNAVAGYQEGRLASGGDATNGFATTFDGGKTWTYGELPKLTNYPGQGGDIERASDAVIAFGPDNTVYANSLIFDSEEKNGTRSAITVNVSKDGGKTWSDPVTFQDDNLGGLNDKNWIVVDNADAPGHHKGRVYVVWDRVAPVVYDYCDAKCDDKANWLPNLQTVPGLVFPGQGIGAYPYVMPNGGLGIAIQTTTNGLPTALQTDNPETTGANQVFFSAPAAGQTPYPAPLVFTPPVQISYNGSKNVRAQRASDGLLAGAADLTAGDTSGTQYVAWDDGRFRKDATNDIVLSSSTDNGVTWATPTRVNPGPLDDNVNHYNAMVAVGSDGAVHVAYRQREEKGSVAEFSPVIDTYYQESRDQGKTWSAPLKVNSKPSLPAYGAFSRNGTFEGDYSQIASSQGSTYIVREQGERSFPGEPPALTPGGGGVTLTDAGKGHQHQRTWVALIKDGTPPAGAGMEGGGAVTTPKVTLRLAVTTKKKLRIRILLKRGLRVRVSANAAITGRLRLVLTRGHKRITVAAKRVVLKSPGSVTVKFKASKQGRRALRRAGAKPRLSLELTAKDASGAPGTASVKLRARR